MRRARDAAFYECLIRMEQHDGQILLAPDIVPVAEKLGLIRLVDHRVLELVVAELAASPAVQLSLNISPDTTMDPDWWTSIESLMRAHPGVGERLIVEITETVAIQDVDDVRGFVTRLKNFGSRIAIDDFGAGYTSFRNLRKLGVDIVKIDGAFVQNIARSADDRAFVQTLIDLARRLEIKTVAEWVQDEEAASMLRDWGCDYIQGRLIGLASSAAALAAAGWDGACPRRGWTARCAGLSRDLSPMPMTTLAARSKFACRAPERARMRSLLSTSSPSAAIPWSRTPKRRRQSPIATNVRRALGASQ